MQSSHSCAHTHIGPQGTGAVCRKWGRADGRVARGDRYPNTALTLVMPVAAGINGGIDVHGESETTRKQHERTFFKLLHENLSVLIMQLINCKFQNIPSRAVKVQVHTISDSTE